MDNNYSSLVKNRDNRNKLTCGGWSASSDTKLINNKPEYSYLKLYCKRWDCPVCGPKRANKLKKAITNKAIDLNLRRFVTLTLDPNNCSAENSIEHIRNCWNKLRTYLKRYCKKSISFIAVLELQKSGYAHLHILVSEYINQKWLSEAWESLGGGKIVDIRWVDIHRVSHYLSKYLTKELLFSTISSKSRRYTTSRDIRLFNKQVSKYKWRLIKMPLDDLYPLVELNAYDVEKDYDCNVRFFKLSFSILKIFNNIPF
jgi:hypothetical protein